mmetsp:Transcript_6522/g.13729  ORF Transcript_6522/g.13729 Transcript_6522/m.13729 type:complete len:200 (-) Transcript_6522:777-1376(-)
MQLQPPRVGLSTHMQVPNQAPDLPIHTPNLLPLLPMPVHRHRKLHLLLLVLVVVVGRPHRRPARVMLLEDGIEARPRRMQFVVALAAAAEAAQINPLVDRCRPHHQTRKIIRMQHSVRPSVTWRIQSTFDRRLRRFVARVRMLAETIGPELSSAPLMLLQPLLLLLKVKPALMSVHETVILPFSLTYFTYQRNKGVMLY